MFLDFFYELKKVGLPVTIGEYLDLLQGMDEGLANFNVDDFYYLSRTVLIKHEQHLDKFDVVFGNFFKGRNEAIPDLSKEIPYAWLERNLEKFLSEEEKEQIKALGGLEKLFEEFQKRLEEQEERHEGGNKWIGTGGTSPFGAYGYNPEGFRVGQSGSRHRRAVKVWDKRTYRNLDDTRELNTRNFKLALKRLRVFIRDGVPEELDIDGTIEKTCKNAGMLDVELVPSKKNKVKVLLLLDVGGSMDDFIEISSRLFSAARHEFKHLEHYYFHNCLYESVWRNSLRRHSEKIPTLEVFHKYNRDYKVIIVGDASMSPYEIVSKYGSVEHYNEEPGLVWLNRLKEHYNDVVWLNPVKPQHWKYTDSIQIIRDWTEKRMFPLTVQGITQAMKSLKNSKITYEV
ncbi:MAG: vWA domain-containing protein [Flammeovirgaceae bacterium]